MNDFHSLLTELIKTRPDVVVCKRLSRAEVHFSIKINVNIRDFPFEFFYDKYNEQESYYYFTFLCGMHNSELSYMPHSRSRIVIPDGKNKEINKHLRGAIEESIENAEKERLKEKEKEREERKKETSNKIHKGVYSLKKFLNLK